MPRASGWLRNAFAVNSPDNAEPTEAQREVAERVCKEVVRRGLATPAIMFLEMSRPMNYVGAQAMHFFQPIVAALFDPAGFDVFAGFLENRASIDYLVRTIERLEGERSAGDERTSTSIHPGLRSDPAKRADF